VSSLSVLFEVLSSPGNPCLRPVSGSLPTLDHDYDARISANEYW
jgi:hypothetical protein